MESQDNSGWKGYLEVSSSNSHSKQGQQLAQARFLRDFSIWVLEISKNGNCTTSLRNLLQCSTIFRVKRPLFIISMNDPGFSLRPQSIVHPPCTMMKSVALSSWWSPHRYCKAAIRLPQKPLSFHQLNKLICLILSSQAVLMALLWICSSWLTCLVYWGA